MEKQLKRISHATGLSVEIDQARWTATPVDGGFTITPLNAKDMRNPPQMSLMLGSSPTPQDNFAETLERDGRKVQLKKGSSEGGSGGAEYYLDAWTACGKTHVTLKASQRSESGTPDFADALEVLWSAKCPN